MPKMKTRKTLTKRIRITSKGKLVKKSLRMGHLKRKLDSSRKFRKNLSSVVANKRNAKTLKRLLGK